jgi:hypothetical protein
MKEAAVLTDNVLLPCPLTLTHLYKYRVLWDDFAAMGMMRMSNVE